MSIKNASGGRPSGPAKCGPPVAEMSTNNAFKGWMRAMGSDTARVHVTGVTMARSGRMRRTTFWRSVGGLRVSLRCPMLCVSTLRIDMAGVGGGTGGTAE